MHSTTRHFSTARLVATTVAAALLIAGMIVGTAAARARKSLAPEPSLASKSWQLSFGHGVPLRMTVVCKKNGQPKLMTYWLFTYSVANNTGKDIYFNPRFDLVTDTGRIIPATVTTTPAMLAKIRSFTGNPFIINPMLITGRLLQGADNAKDGVAVFAGLTSKDRGFRIYVSGLSGETAVQTDPLTGGHVILHKTLELHYSTPGEAINAKPTIILLGTRWVMR